MIVAIGCDHAGFTLKSRVVQEVQIAGHARLDLGAFDDSPSDYPDVARRLAEAIRWRKADRGVLVCGSGVGASVAANKVPGVRAAVCHDSFSARQGVEDDDMNVLCLGARVIGPGLAAEVIRTFLQAQFSRVERHVRRLAKIGAIERDARSGAFDRDDETRSGVG